MTKYEVSEVIAGAVYVYENAFDNGQEIIDILESQGGWNDARVGGAGIGEVNKTIRHNQTATIDPFDFRVNPVLYNFVRTAWNYIDDYATHHEVSFSSLEKVIVNRYYSGDRYLPHSDAGPNLPRVISAVAYLNDVNEGGETEFSLFDVAVKPKAGRIIVFPSNYAYRHAALPPMSGIKYAAALWTRQ